MDLLTVALACSLYADEGLVRAIVAVQSGGNHLMVGDLTALDNVFPQSRADAETALEKLLVQGRRVGLGLLGVPTDFVSFGESEPTPQELWDSCRNIQLGTERLADFDLECRRHNRVLSQGSRRNRACVLRRLAVALGIPPKKFSRLVFRILRVSH